MGTCTVTTKLEDASKPSFSSLPSPREKMTALVDEFLELFYSQTLALQKRRQGKNRKRSARLVEHIPPLWDEDVLLRDGLPPASGGAKGALPSPLPIDRFSDGSI
jgi:hypothetical protein